MGIKVLVVDDATFVRDTIKRSLRRMIPDVELVEAVDGRRAASLIKNSKVDLILSDWEMPEMTGEEFLAWVREHPAHSGVPFIMVTSRGDRDHVMQAVQAGVSDYLSKPFTAEELERKIAKQLKRIGYKPKANPHALSGGSSPGSLDALTGGDPSRVIKPGQNPAKPGKSQASSPAKAESKAEGQAKSKPESKAKITYTTPPVNSHFKGKAWLRFPSEAYECSVREISLQGLNGMLTRPARLPTVFDQAAVDIENEQGETLARLNAYVHSLAAADANPNADTVRIAVRFVDDDPQKLDVLSHIITSN